MKTIGRYDIYFLNTQTYNLFEKKGKNFCRLFQKTLALKVMMHMCTRVKDRVKRWLSLLLNVGK